MKTKVFLIGGAPGAGKTSLGSALARQLGIGSLTIDDLKTAALAITTSESHPKLHAMSGAPAADYFTNSTVDQLITDATAQHEAVWPMVERVVGKHARWGSPMVIDGWYLRPKWVARLEFENVWSAWLVTTAAVLEERERKSLDFFQSSSDPERMFQNFLARSIWYNDLIEAEATEHQMTVLRQTGETSVAELCQVVLDRSEDR